jgi:hypothetical protein
MPEPITMRRWDCEVFVLQLNDGSILFMLRNGMDTEQISLKQQPTSLIQALKDTRPGWEDSGPHVAMIEAWEFEVIFFARNRHSLHDEFSLRLVNGPPYGDASVMRDDGVYVVNFNDIQRLRLIQMLESLPNQ